MLTEAYEVTKTGTRESKTPGHVPEPELGLEPDVLDDSVVMSQDEQGRGRGWRSARPGLAACRN
jgi:hypothetical protein